MKKAFVLKKQIRMQYTILHVFLRSTWLAASIAGACSQRAKTVRQNAPSKTKSCTSWFTASTFDIEHPRYYSKQNAKQYKQKTSPQSYKTWINISLILCFGLWTIRTRSSAFRLGKIYISYFKFSKYDEITLSIKFYFFIQTGLCCTIKERDDEWMLEMCVNNKASKAAISNLVYLTS